jgi:hypothetical protein
LFAQFLTMFLDILNLSNLKRPKRGLRAWGVRH